MTQRLLDLPGKQLAVMPEVAFEGVAVDHDPVLVAVSGDPVAEVLAVGLAFEAEVGDDHRHPLQQTLEFHGKSVDRVSDQSLEAVRLRLIHCFHVNQQPIGSIDMKLRKLGPGLAVLAIAGGGVVWSGCGDGGDDTGTVGDQVQKEVEEAGKNAEEAVDEGVEKGKKGLEEAKQEFEDSGKAEERLDKARKEAEKGLEEGQAKAEKGVEEAQEQAEKYLP